MRPVCAYTDFFVVCTGGNPRQTKAIWDEVHARLKARERPAPALDRGRRRGDVDHRRLRRRRAARLHARGARVLPPRGAVGRRPARDARSSLGLNGPVYRTGNSPSGSAGTHVRVLTTNQKGALAEQAIAASAVELGLGVSRPLDDERYDLILDLRPRLAPRAVQVGDVGTATSSSIRCRTMSAWAATGLIHRRYEPGEIDVIAAYCPDARSVLPPARTSCRSVAPRFSCGSRRARNNQQLGIRWAQRLRVRRYTGDGSTGP